MVRRRDFRKAGAALALVAAGCAAQTAEQQPCPSALVVRAAAEATQFLPGPGRDLTDVIMEAEIRELDGFCEMDLERDGSGEVQVDLTVLFEANRGPANETQGGRFSYFIALVDVDRNILKKPVFDADVTFPGNGNRVRFTEDIELEIPLKAGEAAAGYEILVGLQLTDEQAEYNRSKVQ